MAVNMVTNGIWLWVKILIFKRVKQMSCPNFSTDNVNILKVPSYTAYEKILKLYFYEGGIHIMTETTGGGLFGGLFGGKGIFANEAFFETLLMIIIIIWLLRWLFGFNYGY